MFSHVSERGTDSELLTEPVNIKNFEVLTETLSTLLNEGKLETKMSC